VQEKKEQGQLPEGHFRSFLFQQNFVKQPKSAALSSKIQLQREKADHWLQQGLHATPIETRQPRDIIRNCQPAHGCAADQQLSRSARMRQL
jgi:hypothetical protein